MSLHKNGDLSFGQKQTKCLDGLQLSTCINEVQLLNELKTIRIIIIIIIIILVTLFTFPYTCQKAVMTQNVAHFFQKLHYITNNKQMLQICNKPK